MTNVYPTLLPLLAAQGVAPRKGLGQHYLSDPTILQAIVAAADLPPDAVVIEVGPGPGTLTAALAAVAGRLIAVELDDRLAALLADLYAPHPHVQIIPGDALAWPPAALLAASDAAPPYFLVANLPYYITSPLLRHYLEAQPPPQRAVVTIQRDVARRILAAPPQMSLLALSVQVYAQPTHVRRLPPGAFTPPPKVDSAVLRLDVRPEPLAPRALLPSFFAAARAGFGQKRKTLRNSLAAGLHLPPEQVEEALRAAGLPLQARAQELSIPQWLALLPFLPDFSSALPGADGPGVVGAEHLPGE